MSLETLRESVAKLEHARDLIMELRDNFYWMEGQTEDRLRDLAKQANLTAYYAAKDLESIERQRLRELPKPRNNERMS